jgi:predicted Rossmann fold flavoprotein
MAVAIVGGGAAGLLAAIAGGRAGAPATLLERNPRPGRKILLSGGGRCNLSNAGGASHLVEAFRDQGKFLYGAFTRFGGDDLRALLAEEGVPTFAEEGGRVFPSAGGSPAVVSALERAALKAGAVICPGVTVKNLDRESGGGFRITDAGDRVWWADRIILVSGGITYPSTGSTGDGYRWARELGHTVSRLRPALVALETVETWPSLVMGLSLRDVTVAVKAGGRVWDRSREDVLFTHFGLSGPAVLNVSGQAALAAQAEAAKDQPQSVVLSIRPNPETGPQEWRRRFEDRLSAAPRQKLKNLLETWWPASLAEVLCAETGADPESRAGQLPRAGRDRLAACLFELRLTLKRPRPISEAMVTAGGVSLREVDPRSMASRLVPGLFIAGEMLDVDGPTGGYNLQAAFSTGWLAGASAARVGSSSAED